MGWLDATHPDDRERTMARFCAAHARQEPFDDDYRVRIADGSYRWVADEGRPRLGPGGEYLGYVGSVIDITERKLAEARREELLAAERAARGEAERVGRMKDEFLATLSHELRTPLNAILGWSQLLHAGRVPSTNIASAVETIDRNARAQKQLIEDLLDMSSIISGKVRLELGPMDLIDVVQAAIDSVKPTAESKGVHIETAFPPHDPVVSGDAARLQQVVWNLLSNAVKFTPRGGTVRVAVEATEADGIVRVTDTGVGIDPAFLPHVFDRFAQADPATTRRFGGLGLGLSIVKQIVELHNGTVDVTSGGRGSGATFTVVVPRADTAGDAMPISERSLAGGTSDLVGVRVLVVDDDEDSRELVARVLEGHGAEVVAVGSAQDALAAIERQRPSVLVSDIGMPDVDGYELIARVRALEETRGGHLPSAALTAYTRNADRARALTAGFDAHVPKPLDPSELSAVVARLVSAS
jgi:signal transduction histidine kinase